MHRPLSNALAPRARAALTLVAVVAAALSVARGPALAQPAPPGLDESFPASAIPPSFLLNESEAVVRLDSRRFEVESPSEAVMRVRRVVTVLGPDGREYGRVAIPYDTFREIDDLDGRLLSAEGEEIRDLSSGDIEDYSAISGISLYEENRVRTAALYHDAYPYTVEFTYEVERDGLITWPTWLPQGSTAPVEHTLFEIDTPPVLPARYTARHMKTLAGSAAPASGGQPEVTSREGRRVYRWSAQGLPPRTPEPHAPPWQRRAPRVHTAPAVFEIEGQRGTMDSWQAFGQWYYDLNRGVGEGKGALPPEAAREVQALVEGAASRREKVRRLYRYMQDRTRYVSVQLGVGGWKAFSPAYVHQNGYGDCKALVYFMKALLAEAGIASHPALVALRRGAPEVTSELPRHQFNHLILAVPMPGGNTGSDGGSEESSGNGEEATRLWLECTSQTAPFAHLGAAAEDRHALLVKDGASELVRIPASTAAQNARHRRAEVTLTAEGAAVADVVTRYTGNEQDRVRRNYSRRSARERRDRLRDQTGLPGIEILSADFSAAEARRDTATLPMRLRARQYASRTGARLFFRPNLMARWADVPAPMETERTQPVAYFASPFTATDTLEYALPEGFAVEALPDPVEVETPFATYRATFETAEAGTLQYRRYVEVRTAELPPEQYDAFRAFMQKAARADRAQVVLVKK